MCKLKISGIGGEQASSSGDRAGQANLRVDVENAGLATRRPNNRGVVGLIMLEVILGYGAIKGVCRAGLFYAVSGDR